MPHPLGLTLLIGLLVAPLAAQNRQGNPASPAAYVQVGEARCALFPVQSEMPRFFSVESGAGQLRRFTPTLKQVQQAEQGLLALNLATIPGRHLPGYEHYPEIIQQGLRRGDYQRQYFGYYNSQKQPCLCISLLVYDIEDAPGAVPSWLRAPYQVYDGGSAFWSVDYNLANRQFYGFRHNVEG